MRTLLLVRHAMPDGVAHKPPESWKLSAQGARAAEALVPRLPQGAVLTASAEQKALETLAPSGAVRVDGRLGEVAREEPFDGDFRTRRAAYVGGVDHPGWEPRTKVASRFEAAVEDALVVGRPVVLGTHGMALTVWLTAIGAVTEPVDFWEGLAFPDLLEVSRGCGRALVTRR